eukprot:CAMPEP_0184702620 /NCGR_PEP_ID=MMETSP0313-20130426/24863_1 /TAXON_ID=2792 /ORGANISM="Porphyridium aerugineum, Strain SAG 1380-2" /LENGTH=52 /DNA_ID=CAMNT_0027163153 /DNA_START=1043 /DNA_END=1198 /DNA_ORIENTATION=+
MTLENASGVQSVSWILQQNASVYLTPSTVTSIAMGTRSSRRTDPMSGINAEA